jgi:hypothetical protein
MTQHPLKTLLLLSLIWTSAGARPSPNFEVALQATVPLENHSPLDKCSLALTLCTDEVEYLKSENSQIRLDLKTEKEEKHTTNIAITALSALLLGFIAAKIF